MHTNKYKKNIAQDDGKGANLQRQRHWQEAIEKMNLLCTKWLSKSLCIEAKRG